MTFDCITAAPQSIPTDMEKPDVDRAWRLAVELKLRYQDLIVVSPSKKT